MATTPISHRPPSPLRNAHVLLLDADGDAARRIACVLSPADCTWARTPGAAIQALRRFAPALLVVGAGLPDEDRRRLLHWAVVMHPQLRVLVLGGRTASSHDGRHLELAPGACDCGADWCRAIVATAVHALAGPICTPARPRDCVLTALTPAELAARRDRRRHPRARARPGARME